MSLFSMSPFSMSLFSISLFSMSLFSISFCSHCELPNGEAAWVDIVSDDVCFKEKKVAAFPAFSEDVSVFVNYPQAIEALHKEAAQFVKGMTGGAVRFMSDALFLSMFV